jgi:uncharacterized membrane protein YbaN (DUF454 family)
MTAHEAKAILTLYRPGTADDRDPEFAEALLFARQDPELRDWLARQDAVQQALRARFRQIVPPPGLKEQIISEHHARVRHQLWRRRAALMAVAAVLATLIAVAALWLETRPGPQDRVDLATFRNRMVGAVLRQYAMTLETNDLNQIRAYLAQTNAPADYVLPRSLEQTPSTGCGVLSWQDKKVAMVCFHSGKPLPPGEKTDIFLFVVDREAVPDAPAGREPQIATVKNLVTASWSQGSRVYVLAVAGDESTLRRYLN